jgi:DNA processing protein
MGKLLNSFSNIQSISSSDLDMPDVFRKMESSPKELFFVGNIDLLNKKRISIVGSRNPTPQSIQWMRTHLTSFLKEQNVITISGGAIGIDSFVHQLSIDLRTPTIVFLPSGIRKYYPKSSEVLLDKVLERGGCIISEFPPDVEMRKYHFFMRNRLIAASAEILLLIQAALPSGSYMSAGWAMKHGKTIACLPSFPDSSHYEGNLKLLFEGAQLIRDAEDLTQLMEIC